MASCPPHRRLPSPSLKRPPVASSMKIMTAPLPTHALHSHRFSHKRMLVAQQLHTPKEQAHQASHKWLSDASTNTKAAIIGSKSPLTARRPRNAPSRPVHILSVDASSTPSYGTAKAQEKTWRYPRSQVRGQQAHLAVSSNNAEQEEEEETSRRYQAEHKVELLDSTPPIAPAARRLPAHRAIQSTLRATHWMRRPARRH